MNNLLTPVFWEYIKRLNGDNLGCIANLLQNVSVVFDEINNPQRNLCG
jgi:hypothetical protein